MENEGLYIYIYIHTHTHIIRIKRLRKERKGGNNSGNQLNAFLDLVITNEKPAGIFLQLIHIPRTDFTH